MIVEFYKNESENNKLDKTLTKLSEVDIVLLEEIDITALKIKIKALPLNANYVYIPTLNRYYFITEVDKHYNGFSVCYLNVDVLKSFSDLIKTQSIVIAEYNDDNIENAKLDYTSVNKETLVYNEDMENTFDNVDTMVLTVLKG